MHRMKMHVTGQWTHRQFLCDTTYQRCTSTRSPIVCVFSRTCLPHAVNLCETSLYESSYMSSKRTKYRRRSSFSLVCLLLVLFRIVTDMQVWRMQPFRSVTNETKRETVKHCGSSESQVQFIHCRWIESADTGSLTYGYDAKKTSEFRWIGSINEFYEIRTIHKLWQIKTNCLYGFSFYCDM